MKNKKINISSFLTLMASGIMSCAILSSINVAMAGRDDERDANKDALKESEADKVDSGKRPEDLGNPSSEKLPAVGEMNGALRPRAVLLTSGVPSGTNGDIAVGSNGASRPHPPVLTWRAPGMVTNGGIGPSILKNLPALGSNGTPTPSPLTSGAPSGTNGASRPHPSVLTGRVPGMVTNGGAPIHMPTSGVPRVGTSGVAPSTFFGWASGFGEGAGSNGKKFLPSPGVHGSYTWGGQGNGENSWAHMTRGNVSEFPNGPYSQAAGMAAARAAIVAYISTYTHDYSSGAPTSGEVPVENQPTSPMGGGFSANGALNGLDSIPSFSNTLYNQGRPSGMSGNLGGEEEPVGLFDNISGRSIENSGESLLSPGAAGPDSFFETGDASSFTLEDTPGQNQPTSPTGRELSTTTLFQGVGIGPGLGSDPYALEGSGSIGSANQMPNSGGYNPAK